MQRHSFSGPLLPSKPLEYSSSHQSSQQQQQEQQQQRSPQPQYQYQGQGGSYYDDERSEQYFRERLQNVRLSAESSQPRSFTSPQVARPRSALQSYAGPERPLNDGCQSAVYHSAPIAQEFSHRQYRDLTGDASLRTSQSRTAVDNSLHSSMSSFQPLSSVDGNKTLRTKETVLPQPSSGKIARKPVVMDVELAPTKPLRKYRTPRDLDRLIPRKDVAVSVHERQPLPSDMLAQQDRNTQPQHRHMASRALPQLTIQQQYQTAYTPGPQRRILGPHQLPVAHHTMHAQNPRSPLYHSSTAPSPSVIQPSPHSDMANDTTTTQMYGLQPRRNSIPLQMPVPPMILKSQSSPEAFMPSARLQPNHMMRPGSISPEHGEQIRMTRAAYHEVDTGRVYASTLSASGPLSTSPLESSGKLYRHPISELESYHQGRIPSPDRSMQFPDAPYEYVASTSPIEAPVRQTTVLPESQARRGRQRGEAVVESDLPAMPPLFASEAVTQSLPPSLSPKGNQASSQTSPKLPQSPKKQGSIRHEHDPLQSIKCLPVEPIRRPALCLEERFHPVSYAKSSKFKIKVRIEQNPFVAGGEIFGYVEIISDEGFRAALGSTQVLVGKIGVEVLGCEEISHIESAHEPRSLTFLFGKKVFQERADMHPKSSGLEHIVTSAVTFMPVPDADGYRVPSKGTTCFPFAFNLPVDAPSSAELGIARIRYTVTGYATVKLQGSMETIATTIPVRVVEAWDIHNPVYKAPVEASQGRDIANYNEVHVKASLPKSLFLEGDEMYGHIRIANHGARKVREVKFYLMNRITFFADKRTDVRETNPTSDWCIDSEATSCAEPHLIMRGSENSWQFKLDLPDDKCLTIRNTALFEVTPFVLIKISTGPLFKSIKLALPPICIADRASMIDDTQMAPTHRSGGKSKFVVPNMYKFQRVINGEAQIGQMGVLETTNLMTYVDAHARVQALS